MANVSERGLAVALRGSGVKYTPPDVGVLKQLRLQSIPSSDGLTAASQVIGLNFQAVSAANSTECS
ncbi:MAG: hypothetical protein K2Q97_20525 [Burkholderiaceae bacterium]|nr:hypothetical protein [Burkholderiaceae bacterium]